ncbi:MAG TPA: hypothetical protein VF043_13325 [Ktedonobacteraceae bacterium]
MSSGEYQLHGEQSVPLIYRLHRWFFAASIVLGTAATCVMVATNPGYYNSQTGEAGLLAGYASANVVMVQIHLISAVITFYLLPVGLVVMAWLAMRRATWLASIGAFLVLLGMLPLPALAAAVESLTYDIVRTGSNPLLITMVKQFNNDGVMSFYNIVDIPGVVLGPALVGLALWRARAVPIWAAVLVTFSRLVVFLFPFFPSLPGVYLQLPSCVLLFIGGLPAALAVLRAPYNGSQST